jgi:hypothetical protein
MSMADSVKLNNTANFESLNSAEPDDYDAYHATNYMHEILEKNNFSDNASHTDTNSGNNSDHEHSSSQSSNSDSHHHHHHHHHHGQNLHNHQDLNYPPPAGHNLPIQQQQHQQKPLQTFNPSLFAQANTPALKPEPETTNQSTASYLPSATASVEPSVNPFFMQHPYFGKQFQSQTDSSAPKTSNSNNYV